MAIDHAASDGSEPPKRRRGRPRDPGADRRILTAARAVAADVGIQGSSMSAIADRSGVGKPTIYLRWANRHELMLAALADLRGAVVTEHTGSTREDLLRCLLEDRETLVTGHDARFLRSALFECETDAEIAQQLETVVLGPRRERLVAILRRGVREGRVRSDVEPEGLADLLSGPLMRAMVVGGRAAVEDEALRAHVDVVVDGIGVAPPAGAGRT
jgi:AcrR family transcriptional regulator